MPVNRNKKDIKRGLLEQLGSYQALIKQYESCRAATLEALIPFLCPFSVGQVIRWGGLSHKAAPAVIETVSVRVTRSGTPYWSVWAFTLKKDRTRSKQYVECVQGCWDFKISAEPVDDRTRVQVLTTVQQKFKIKKIKL